jgi:hypothetical protein
MPSFSFCKSLQLPFISVKPRVVSRSRVRRNSRAKIPLKRSPSCSRAPPFERGSITNLWAPSRMVRMKRWLTHRSWLGRRQPARSREILCHVPRNGFQLGYALKSRRTCQTRFGVASISTSVTDFEHGQPQPRSANAFAASRLARARIRAIYL